jgi:hypothetical protein
MGKKIPNYRKKAIEEREAKGIKTRKRRKDYTAAQWEAHEKAVKKANYERWYKNKGKEGYRRKLGYVKRYTIKKPIWWICDWCGNEFKAKPWRGGKKCDRKFCSQKCAGTAYKFNWREKGRLKLEQIRNEKAKFVYQIIVTDKYIQKKSLGKYVEKSEAFDAIETLLEENKNILLPRKFFFNNGELNKSNDELLLIKLECDDDEIEPAHFPNEYGKLMENVIDSAKSWSIINKYDWNVEDKFHHLGHSKICLLARFENDKIGKYRDKDAKYILDNLIFDDKTIDIFIHNCYLILKYDVETIELIYSPHTSMVIELYKFLKEFAKENRYSNINFMGTIDPSKKLCEIYDEIISNKIDAIYIKELEKIKEENAAKKNKNNSKSIEEDN